MLRKPPAFRMSGCGSTSRSRADSTITPARSSRRFSATCPASAAFAPAGVTTTWPSLYTSQQLPGIGASLGLDRLLAAMEELGMVPKVSTPAEVFIAVLRRGPPARLPAAGRQLRAAGLGVEVYPEPKKLGQQLKYADRRGFRVAIIAGEQEFGSQSVQLKNLGTGESQTVPLSGGVGPLVETIRGMLMQR